MAESRSYDLKRPTSPVPIERVAIVVREAARRWWSMYSSYLGDDQMKWFDADIALREGADRAERLAVLAALKGDAYVDDLIERAIERYAPAEDAA